MRTGIAKHLGFIAGAGLVMVALTVYPFLPGKYDPLASPLSLMSQMVGFLGLAFVPLGIGGQLLPQRMFAIAAISLVVGTFIALILALIATLAVGKSLGILSVVVLLYALSRIVPAMLRKRSSADDWSVVPLYLISLPVIAFAAQLALAAPMTQRSRDLAIVNAAQFIDDIDRYHAQYGVYPASLQAQHKDYETGVVGVEKYFYAAEGESYNLSFEQPRFMHDIFGTREWVVYNPRDDNRAYSHTSWHLLPNARASAPQGWYASGNTSHRHWKYFLFD